jgi:taurine dioxygenase
MTAQTAVSTSPTRNFEIIPMKAELGAEIRCGDLRTLNDADRRVIRQAWIDHLVILIRGQSFKAQDLIDFAKSIGEIDIAAPDAEMPDGQAPRFNPHLSVVSNIVEKGVPLGSLGDGEVVWHTDHSYHKVPINASVLFAVECPVTGGNTGFINMYRALETLPADLRAKIENARIKHDPTLNSAGQIRRGLSIPEDVSRSSGTLHPAIRRHPDSGHDALYLGRRPYAWVEGLSVADSEALLNTLWAHATSQPAWYNEWKPGDVVAWDNRCVMHRREPFDPSARRMMYRAQTRGSAPTRGDGSVPGHHPRARAAG